MTRPTIAIAGPRGLAADLVALILCGADHLLTDAVRADVLVLVDPTAQGLEGARHRARVVVVLSRHVSPAQAAEFVRRGADAVLHAGSAPEELLRAVSGCGDEHDANAGDEHDRRSSAMLTARELEILRSIDLGASVKQTARLLGITPKTVENLQSRLFRKLGVRNRAQAMTRAHALGLLDTRAGGPVPTH